MGRRPPCVLKSCQRKSSSGTSFLQLCRSSIGCSTVACGGNVGIALSDPEQLLCGCSICADAGWAACGDGQLELFLVSDQSSGPGLCFLSPFHSVIIPRTCLFQ